MKSYYFLFCLFFFVGSFGYSQNDLEEIEKEIKLYYKALKEEDYDSRLNYFHPKVFEVLSKKELRDEMMKVFSNKEIKFEFLGLDIISVSDIIFYDGKKYALVHDLTKLKMTFVDFIDKPIEETEIFLGLVKENLESKYENRKASISSDTASIIVSKKEYSFVIYEEHIGWKILEYNMSLKNVFEEIIPSYVRLKLKIK